MQSHSKIMNLLSVYFFTKKYEYISIFSFKINFDCAPSDLINNHTRQVNKKGLANILEHKFFTTDIQRKLDLELVGLYFALHADLILNRRVLTNNIKQIYARPLNTSSYSTKSPRLLLNDSPIFVKYSSVKKGSTEIEIIVYLGIVWGAISSYGGFRSGLKCMLDDLKQVKEWTKKYKNKKSIKVRIEPKLSLPEESNFDELEKLDPKEKRSIVIRKTLNSKMKTGMSNQFDETVFEKNSDTDKI